VSSPNSECSQIETRNRIIVIPPERQTQLEINLKLLQHNFEACIKQILNVLIFFPGPKAGMALVGHTDANGMPC
jgi:hypothetical protein